MLSGTLKLYGLLDEGEEAISLGHKAPLANVLDEIRSELATEKEEL